MESEAELLNTANSLLEMIRMDMADLNYTLSLLPRSLGEPIETCARAVFLKGLSQP